MKAINEILTTEKSYVNYLETCLKLFMKPIKVNDMISRADRMAIFSDMELLVMLNKQLLKELEERVSEWPVSMVGDIFIKTAPIMELYSRCIQISIEYRFTV